MNLLLTFSYKISLRDWENLGIIEREIAIYQKLSKKGIKVWFLTYGDESDIFYSRKLKDINIIPIKNKIKYFPLLKTILFSLFNYNLFKNIEIIKTNQMEGSWITWILKKVFRKKLIIRCGYEVFKNATLEYMISKKKRLLFRLLFLYIVELISYKLSDLIILSNNCDKEFVNKYFKIKPNKIALIPNFVDTKIFRPIPTEKKEKSILFIGRLEVEKNLLSLIESFKYLDGYSLDIVGIGEQKQLLVNKVKELDIQSQINFLGVIPNSKIPRLMNNYHILILPSLWEGNPKVILEGMSCGLTCIGTKIPNIKEIIIHKKNGFLCDKDSKSIAETIKYAYNNTNLRESIVRKAREDIERINSLEKIYKKELLIYKNLLKTG